MHTAAPHTYTTMTRPNHPIIITTAHTHAPRTTTHHEPHIQANDLSITEQKARGREGVT